MSVDRLGRGPWARLFASALVPDEGSAVAERGRSLVGAGEVQELEIAAGKASARVGTCTVSVSAAPVPPRIWTAVARFARGNRPLEAGVSGNEQSVHLEHLLTVDWDAPLVPRREAISRSCTCDRGGTCEHVAALAYAVAQEIDRDPSLLLRWRGCGAAETEAEPEAAAPLALGDDPWLAGALPPARPLRPLPVGAVLKRLGPSGVRVGGVDLADVLLPAYAAFEDGR
jgi:uncharacterized Zn finger protein